MKINDLNNKIINGNSLEELKKIPNESFGRASTILLVRPAASGSRGRIPERLNLAPTIPRTLQKPEKSQNYQY